MSGLNKMAQGESEGTQLSGRDPNAIHQGQVNSTNLKQILSPISDDVCFCLGPKPMTARQRQAWDKFWTLTIEDAKKELAGTDSADCPAKEVGYGQLNYL
jgi:hypothetical protein